MKYDWREAGEEWSAPWGSSAAQWGGAILPRIRDCLPVCTILEIAPGFGRWTHYLKDYCEKLWVVDRSSECIEACRERFAADSHVRCYLNDGRSLSMIPDGSVDFVFSFDSFVHPDREIVEAYLRELGTKPLIKLKILDWAHHRNPEMSAELFRALCAQHGLYCITQELVNWRGRRLIDCLSLFARSHSAPQNATKVVRNPNFMREAAQIRRRRHRRD